MIFKIRIEKLKKGNITSAGLLNDFSLQAQFVLLTIHTGYNLFAECDFPDSMNAVVFAYCVSLIILFSNFYYQSYITRKSKKS